MAGRAKAADHSARYGLVKKYYVSKLWSIERLRKAVMCKWITADEYKEITGEEYVKAE